MGYLISLEDVTPPGREDGRPWTAVKIEEAEAPEDSASWTVLEEIPITDPDADPEHPIARNFSTDQGTLAPGEGWYRLTLTDEGEGTYTMNPVRLARRWEPTEADVGTLIPSRTKVPGGDYIGTFNDETKPKAHEVRRIIGIAARRVASAIGENPCTPALREDAKACTAMLAAMLIEQGYWPEQTNNQGSSFRSMKELFDPAIKTLTEAVGEKCGGGDGESVGGSGQMPAAAIEVGELLGRNWPEW